MIDFITIRKTQHGHSQHKVSCVVFLPFCPFWKFPNSQTGAYFSIFWFWSWEISLRSLKKFLMEFLYCYSWSQLRYHFKYLLDFQIFNIRYEPVTLQVWTFSLLASPHGFPSPLGNVNASPAWNSVHALLPFFLFG